MHIDKKIEFWQKKLLDLGKRNKLINLPAPKSTKRISRSTLQFISPDSNYLWKQLVDNNSKIEIQYVDDFYDYDGEDDNINDNGYPSTYEGIKTNQSLTDSIKTLRLIKSKSREFMENKGFNILNVAFGFLNWYENGTKGQQLRSPIFLVPVSITQNSLTDPIIISRTDEEVIVNESLIQKLLSDFDIKLPQYNDSDDWIEYTQKVEQVCSVYGWKTETENPQIVMVSFLKVSMFNDLTQNIEKIASNEIIKLINGEAVKIDTSDYENIGSYNHDIEQPSETYSVVDADSSQQDAIMLAKKGKSFVLQGPPGTGKSQTITNIIAELLAQGKKILFVSEKRAALEVVYKRLVSAGINDFCLSLHDPNASRQDIMNQIKSSIELAENEADITVAAKTKLNLLMELRNSLNSYTKQLHTKIEPFGETVYKVNGYIASLEKYHDISYIQSDVENFTQVKFQQYISVFEELTRIVQYAGYQQKNPWRGSIVKEVTRAFKQRFSELSKNLADNIFEGSTLYKQLSEIIQEINLRQSANDTDSWIELLEISANSNGVPEKWLTIELSDIIIQLNKCIKKRSDLNEQIAFCEKFKLHNTSIKECINNISTFIIQKNTKKAEKENIRYSELFNLFYSNVYAGKPVPFSDESVLFIEKVQEFLMLSANLSECIAKSGILQKEFEGILAHEATEKSLLDELSADYENKKKIILISYKESILNVDIFSIIQRYQRNYKSIFRFFNSQYRRDKKELQSYSNTNQKTSYKEALDIMEKVLSAQTARDKFNTQTSVVSDIVIKRNNKSKEIDSNNLEIKNLEFQIKTSQHSVIEFKKSLIEKIDNEYMEQLSVMNELSNSLNKLISFCNDYLGIIINQDTDCKNIIEKINWTINFVEISNKYDVDTAYRLNICHADIDFIEKITEILKSLKAWYKTHIKYLTFFAELFDLETASEINNFDIYELKNKLDLCQDISMLEIFIDYREVENRINDMECTEFLEKIRDINLPAEDIVPCYKKSFYNSWIDKVIENLDSIRNFRGQKQENKIDKFKELDKEHLEISRAMLKLKLIKQLPKINSPAVNGQEVTFLKRELNKQRKLMPIRKIISSLPTLLPALKPCIMMSPLSVSTYFSKTNYQFDTVIFDEASQLRTEDAICSIFRAKQVIIAGDSKQMPPTNFFNTSISVDDEYNEDKEDIDDVGAYESLLDEASVLPTQTLLWHYRSKHEQLIAFSNYKIYNGNLITFPSAIENESDIGVEYVYVENGIYERGGYSGNRIEAEKVVDLVFEHIRTNGERSLGIIAFSESQQSIIEDAVIRRRREFPEYEYFFNDSKEESMFIRNLETVQGDERDTIIFSIGYGFDATGKFLMNFGPLNKKGGERRLNVAVTRAKYNLKLVGSILPTDIKDERTNSLGPKLLKQYIDYAINGTKTLLANITTDDYTSFDSPFEESVYNFLTDSGYSVATQIGCSGYRIDLAIKHPEYNGRFALGIECDGAAYHSARTARERDRLRQSVLENMGWKIYRIWSTDWIKNTVSEKNKLIEAVNSAIENYHENIPVSKETNKMNSSNYIKEVQHSKNADESLLSKFAGANINDVPIKDIENTILKVLKSGYGYDKETLIKSTSLYGYKWKRVGSRIKTAIDTAYNNLLSQNKIYNDNGITKIKK